MNEASKPLITVIVATYNSAATLQQCIDSVADQTYKKKELIIIDGASSDGTLAILETSREKISLFVSEPDHGIYNAWNKGLVQAQGEWICFLGSDDYFYDSHVLERTAKYLMKVPASIHVAYSRVMRINADGVTLYYEGKPWNSIKQRFLQMMCLPHQGVMHRRVLFKLHGQFNETFRISGDYEFLIRELKKNDAHFFPDIVSVVMRQGGISSQPEYSLSLLLEMRRAQRMHNLPFPVLFWLKTVPRAFLRVLFWKVLGEKMARKIIALRRRAMGLPEHWVKP